MLSKQVQLSKDHAWLWGTCIQKVRNWILLKNVTYFHVEHQFIILLLMEALFHLISNTPNSTKDWHGSQTTSAAYWLFINIRRFFTFKDNFIILTVKLGEVNPSRINKLMLRLIYFLDSWLYGPLKPSGKSAETFTWLIGPFGVAQCASAQGVERVIGKQY